MLLKKIKNIVNDNRRLHKKTFLQSKELEWAHIYHDSIRGVNWLETLSLNIGRWAGNYSFFYVLNRILKEYKPKEILEFGLGESTKFIESYIENDLISTKHLVIEQDANWKDLFLKRNKVNSNTNIIVAPIVKKKIKGHEVNCYKDIEISIDRKFDLYLIDGPFGSPRFSRYDIVTLAKKFNNEDEFIIIIDDYHRKGEKDTTAELIEVFKNKNIDINFGTYDGNKSVAILATKKYEYATTL